MAQSIRKQTNDDPLLSAGIAGQKDPYRLETDDVIEPPQTISASLRRIGPGMILAFTLVLLLGGGYERIELLAMIKEVF